MGEIRSTSNKTEPQQKRAIETREKLISAAVELFNEKGFYDTTTKDISNKAGVSIGIFYNYFKDKSKIYYECVNSSYDIGNIELLRFAKELFKYGISKEKIYNYFYNGLEHIKKRVKILSERDRIRVDYPEIDELIKRKDKEVIKIISDYLLGEDSEIAARLIIETTSRNTIVISTLEDPIDQEKYMKYVADMIYYFCEKFQKK